MRKGLTWGSPHVLCFFSFSPLGRWRVGSAQSAQIMGHNCPAKYSIGQSIGQCYLTYIRTSHVHTVCSNYIPVSTHSFSFSLDFIIG